MPSTATMPPRVIHLTAYEGADFESEQLTAYDGGGSVINLTGATVVAEIRDRPHGTLYFTPTCTVGAQPSQGHVTLSLTDLQITPTSVGLTDFGRGLGVLVIDVEVTTSGGTVYRTHTGTFRVVARTVD